MHNFWCTDADLKLKIVEIRKWFTVEQDLFKTVFKSARQNCSDYSHPPDKPKPFWYAMKIDLVSLARLAGWWAVRYKLVGMKQLNLTIKSDWLNFSKRIDKSTF